MPAIEYAAPPTFARASFDALGTTAHVVVTAPDRLEEAEAALRADLDAVDAACSRFRTDSDLSRLNARAGALIPIPPLLAEFVGVALRMADLTRGRVDPTVGRSMTAAGYDRSFGEMSSAGPTIAAARYVRAAGWRLVEHHPDGHVRLPEGAALDLGATAKASWSLGSPRPDAFALAASRSS